MDGFSFRKKIIAILLGVIFLITAGVFPPPLLRKKQFKIHQRDIRN